MGGADVIRQALEAGLVDELTIIVAPVVLGGGKRLFEGFSTLAGARAPRRAPVAVRDVHRLPGEEQPRGLSQAGARAFRSNLCQALSPRRKPHVPLRRAQTMIGR